MLAEDIGYIYLYEFAGESEKEFATAFTALKEQGAKSLIVDVRDNPGGWVDAARDIGDLFLPPPGGQTRRKRFCPCHSLSSPS